MLLHPASLESGGYITELLEVLTVRRVPEDRSGETSQATRPETIARPDDRYGWAPALLRGLTGRQARRAATTISHRGEKRSRENAEVTEKGPEAVTSSRASRGPRTDQAGRFIQLSWLRKAE